MEKNKQQEEEERYYLTPLGFLLSKCGDIEGREIFDALELYARRICEVGEPAIIFCQGGGIFSSVEHIPEAEKPKKERQSRPKRRSAG